MKSMKTTERVCLLRKCLNPTSSDKSGCRRGIHSKINNLSALINFAYDEIKLVTCRPDSRARGLTDRIFLKGPFQLSPIP